MFQNFLRVVSLVKWARPQRFDLAVSHNSYSQSLAAWLLQIPVVTLMDYEHQPLNHFCFRLAARVIVPECFPAELIHTFGATQKNSGLPRSERTGLFGGFYPSAGFPPERRPAHGSAIDRCPASGTMDCLPSF